MVCIEEYIEFDNINKLKILLTEGVHLATVDEGNITKSIFQINKFFVEVWRSTSLTHIRQIIVSEDLDILNKYLSYIDIGPLFDEC